MKKVIVALALLVGAASVSAQEWKLDKSHSSVNFTITHMMVSEVQGNFKDFSANITSSKEDFSDLNIDFTIMAGSINTADDKRDEHLRGDDFFSVDKFPKITFKSTDVKKLSDKKFAVTGDLTIKGITKKVTWDVKYNGKIADGRGGVKAGFKANYTINRKDFNITYNHVLDAGGVALSDEVEVVVNVELNKVMTK
ncbi:MAG: YceI family protein [Chitinophagales bacterium]